MATNIGFKIFISHRIGYQDIMYWDVCSMLDRAVENNIISSWTNLSLPPHRDIETQLGRKVSDTQIIEMVASRVQQSSAVLIVDRKAASFGNFVIDELTEAVKSTTPIICLQHPSFRIGSGQLPWNYHKMYESAWRFDSLGNTLVIARGY